jgi:acyl-lipid omega-6 desaturase (Delta-12 desaturase)
MMANTDTAANAARHAPSGAAEETSAPRGARSAPSDAGGWGRALRPYRKASGARAAYELAITSMAFVGTVWAMLWAVDSGVFFLHALLFLPAAGLLVRLFVIQHDCAHRSFFPSRAANDWVGRLIGVATLTPHDHWRMSHAYHHASSGNLDRRGIGDVYTLTVAEYLARSPWGRLRYRLYRHPAVTFGVGPLYLFLFHNRLPVGFMRNGWAPWLSTMATNLAIVAALTSMILVTGLRSFVWIYVPIVVVATVVGVWLFYVQHQFENTYWAKGPSWNAQDAALRGSSYYYLPGVIRWFTANIGSHHVHHLSSRIPFYRLPEVLHDHQELRDHGRVTVLQSLRAVRLVLWDESRRRLVSFKQLRCGEALA